MKIATFNINNINSRLGNLLPWLAEAKPDVVCLQDDAHVGFMSMIESIMTQAEEHLEREDSHDSVLACG